MRLKIQHSTRYTFDEPVVAGLQQVRKTPKTFHQQWVSNWTTTVTGGTKQVAFEDQHRNVVELVSYDRGATEVVIVSEGEVELHEADGIVGRHRGPAPLWLYKRHTPRTEAKAGVAGLVRGVDEGGTLARMHLLSTAIREAITYKVGASHPDWTAEDAINAGEGVCQDHTHVFLACARAMGVPARYVSGYLMLNDRTTQDAMHAWAEAHVEDLGWVGFDVSNGISPDTRYIRVATGLDYSDAAPIIGTRRGGTGEALDVKIEVAQQ